MFGARFTFVSGIIAIVLGHSFPAAAALLASDISVSPTPISGLVEGAGLTNGTVASIFDSNSPGTVSDYSAVIHWGDGTTSAGTILSGSVGVFTVTGSHTYADEGTYFYSTDVTYVPLGFLAIGVLGQTVVADAALNLISTTFPISFTPGVSLSNIVLATFGDANPFPPILDFAGSINWGDGAISAGSIIATSPGVCSVEGSHTYSSGGSLPVLINIVDVGGSSLSTRTTAVSSTVPEPSSLALLSLGLAGLLRLRRRKQ